MEFRPGLCSACKASFRIPATFTANKAKCSKCGGTVEIGAVTSDTGGASSAAPNAPPVPAKAISAPVAAAAARLAAKPEAIATQPVSAKSAAQRPAAAPVPTSATSKPAAVPVKATPPVKPAVAAKSPASSSANKTAAASASPAKPVSAAKPNAGRVDEDDGEDERAARRQRLEKRKGMSPVLIGVSLLLSIAVGSGVWIMYSKVSAQNAEKAAVAVAEKAKKNEELRLLEVERTRLAAEALAADAPETKPTQSGEVLAAESAKNPADAEAEAGAKAAAAKPVAKGPVEGYDLSKIADFAATEGTTPEEWTRLQEDAALFVDFSAGARSSRAGNRLMETPKQSFPAILNQFKKLNLEDETGYRMADATQKLLERICKGHNVGWKYEQQENWLQYNQKAIKKWCDLWTRASTDEAFWNSLIKNDGSKPADGDAPADGTTPPKKVDDF